MPRYQYTARNASGEIITAIIDAANETEVISSLDSQHLVLLGIEVTRAKNIDPKAPFLQPKIKLESLVIFTRQMYSLLKAGVPLLRALNGLVESTQDKVLKKALHQVCLELENGHPFSAALRMQAYIFSDLFIALVRVGESTGRLDETMLQLSEYYEKEMETRRRLRSAVRYPSLVMIAIISAFVILNVAVIPKFAGIFARFKANLPLPTQILMAISNFFVNYWWVILFVTLCFVGGFLLWKNGEKGRIRWDRRKLKIYLIGGLINRALMSRFSRTFALMLRAGVPINNALNSAGDALNNQYLAFEVEKMKAAIESGVNLSSSAADTELFTPLVHQMITVGEETGQIDNLLLEVSDYYDREVDYDLKVLSTRLEPFLLLMLAAMVLVLALGIFLPMWDMLEVMKNG